MMIPPSNREATHKLLECSLPSVAPGQSSESNCTKRRRYTFGFPALQTESKRVSFTEPLYARCVALDGSWSTDCRVLIVWNEGARVFARNPKHLARFVLFFVSNPKPVFRRCKTVWIRGNELEVHYERLPGFALERNPLDKAPLRLLDQ